MIPPLTFRPLLKQIRWGGRRLGTVLGKPIGEASDYAESWEVVDHGNDQSVVDGGPLDGLTLDEVVKEHTLDLFGEKVDEDSQGRRFPLLIKFLDATDRLSVQVHPDDPLAKRYDPEELGKTESWVILDVEPGAKLYAGLREGVDASVLRAALREDRVEDVLHAVDVKPGDCLFIPAGTVHAIGEGVLLAEVQQSSDLTFRLSDWGRVGSDGRPRQLHVEESIEATDFTRGPVNPQTAEPVDGGERLCTCDYFTIVRQKMEAGETVRVPSGECRILIGVDGRSAVRADGNRYDLSKGRTVLIPARTTENVMIETEGDGTVLDVTLGRALPA